MTMRRRRVDGADGVLLPSTSALVINTVLEPIGVAPNRTVTVHTPGEPMGMPCSIGSTAAH